MSRGRGFYRITRLSENFTEQGLKSLTGESERNWAKYVVKELLDNSLDATEGYADTPEIDLTLEIDGGTYRSYVSKVVVEDNGPGIPEDDMAAIFDDVSVFAGSKRHYSLLFRGNQGNALMTILGIQYLSGAPLVVETDGTRHTIQVMQDAKDEWQVERDTKPTDVEGTRIVVDFSEDYYCGADTVDTTIGAFVALNPHVRWDIDYGAHDPVFEAATDTTVERFSPRGSATTGKVLWFSFDDFHNRLKADARANPSLTLEDIVTEFAKLTSNKKASAVFDGIEEYRHQQIGEFLEEHSDEGVQELYDSMVAETKAYSERGLDSTLGCVGSDLTHSLHNYLRFMGQFRNIESLAQRLSEYSDSISEPSDITIYSADGGVVQPESSEKTVPFYFEFAAIPMPDEKYGTKIQFGINQSVAYSTPDVSVEFSANQQHYDNDSIKSAIEDAANHPYYIVTNLTCPNIDFEDKGKQSFDTKPFEDTISGVLKTAVGKIGREIRPRLNDLRSEDKKPKQQEELSNKMPMSYKDFVFKHFDDVYNRMTENGQLTINKHQFYYNIRELLTKTAEQNGWQYANDASVDNPKKVELKKKTYNGIIDDYETEVLGKRVLYRDKRGFFVEPHTNNRITIQTSTVNRYEPPEQQFGSILLVEKTGFYEQIHKEFEFTKKYDIGLIAAKGYSSNAARDLVEKIQGKTDATLYTLTDLDIDGLNIASDAVDSDDVSTFGEFDAERIGVEVSDLDEYGLTPEPVNYSDKKLTQLKNMLEAGDVSEEEYQFLTKDGGKRVEINTLPPTELREYLSAKIEELGIEKVTPTVDDIDEPEEKQHEAIERAVGSWVIEQTKDDILESLEDELASEDTTREEIRERIVDEISDNPPEGWQDVEKDIHSEIKEEWRDEARDHLQENVTIEVKIDE